MVWRVHYSASFLQIGVNICFRIDVVLRQNFFLTGKLPVFSFCSGVNVASGFARRWQRRHQFAGTADTCTETILLRPLKVEMLHLRADLVRRRSIIFHRWRCSGCCSTATRDSDVRCPFLWSKLVQRSSASRHTLRRL